MFPGLTDEDFREAQRRADPRHHGGDRRQRRRGEAQRRRHGTWSRTAQYNRRIHMGTEMAISGPAAGDDRLKTKADPTGTVRVRHHLQLQWRHHALGHDAVRRGRRRWTSSPATTRRCPNQELVERQGWDEEENDLYFAVAHRAALQVRGRAERVDEVRLGGRDRSVRSDRQAGQAHRARPLHA